MKKIIAGIFFSLIVVLGPGSAYSEPFKIPPLIEDEVGDSNVYYLEGEIDVDDMPTSQRTLYWEAPVSIRRHTYWVGEGSSRRPQITLTEQRRNTTTAVYTFYFKPGKDLILESFEEKVVDKSGKEVRREYRNLTHPLLDLPDDLVHAYTVDFALRSLDFTKTGSERNFSILLPPATVVVMIAEVKGVENITLRDGTVWSCYRVDIRPDLVKLLGPILGRIISPFIGDYNFWYDTRGNHPLIKYQGPMGKVNTGRVPTEIYETSRTESRPAKTK